MGSRRTAHPPPAPGLGGSAGVARPPRWAECRRAWRRRGTAGVQRWRVCVHTCGPSDPHAHVLLWWYVKHVGKRRVENTADALFTGTQATALRASPGSLSSGERSVCLHVSGTCRPHACRLTGSLRCAVGLGSRGAAPFGVRAWRARPSLRLRVHVWHLLLTSCTRCRACVRTRVGQVCGVPGLLTRMSPWRDSALL